MKVKVKELEKMKYDAGEYDIAVVGAGHAGCEAALAAARMGMKTLLFSISLEAVANMPCNPHIGGSSKGHLVREIDCLGGEMGKNIDKTFVQMRMLNTSKGPAVYSLRAQADRKKYQMKMKHTLERQPNLYLKQAEIVDIGVENNKITSIETNVGAVYKVKEIILCTGTYLRGKIFIGENSFEGGPDGVFPANKLSKVLEKLNIKLLRFKTGTPARVHADTLDYSKMELEEGDEKIVPFSFETENVGKNLVPCYLVYTNEKTHQIIHDNLGRSAMYGGMVEGIGPRYCPSIEDKVVRFSGKPRHQLFMEPMGIDTKEVYAQGFSTSMPEDVQLEMYRSVEGLENVEIMRPAYAIEYDCCDPTQLYATLEFKNVHGLYGAGQFNGTSGYEEAASQGLIAGINAALKLKNEEPLTLKRSDGYIGTLIDDLITKGTNEPYRMMTSRSEYRLLLRQDNADERLTPFGYKIGLISEERYKKFLEKMNMIENEIKRVTSVIVPPKDANPLLEQYNSTAVKTGIRLSDMIKRPELDYEKLAPVDHNRLTLPDAVCEQVEIKLKYDGYIKRQIAQVEQFKKMEEKLLPENQDYSDIHGLRLEARQKLNKIQPKSLGQASRISGVSPSDMSVLIVWLESQKR